MTNIMFCKFEAFNETKVLFGLEEGMAIFFNNIDKECESKNRINRNVKEYNRAINLDGFWRKAVSGNFLITGGNEEQRTVAVAAAIKEARVRFSGPIIILNGSELCEKRLISMASSHNLGKLIVSSPYYKNYELFYGMSENDIRALLRKQAQKNGVMDLASFEAYSEAFLKIVESTGMISYRSILALARNNDVAIADYGKSRGIDRYYLNCIEDEKAGNAFRIVVRDYGKAFINIMSAQRTDITISRINDSNTVYCFWADSADQNALNEVLAYELNELKSNRRINYYLIINDVNLQANDPLLDVISHMKNKKKFGMCCTDVISYPDVGMKNKLTANFPAIMVLNSGGEDYEDQQQILSKFGSYRHFESVMQVHGLNGRIPFFRQDGGNVSMTQYDRPRVMVEDMQGYEVAVRGDHGDVVSLYGSLGIW